MSGSNGLRSHPLIPTRLAVSRWSRLCSVVIIKIGVRPKLSMARIFSAMFDGTILSDELIVEMTEPLLESSDYGLGIRVGDVDGVVTYTHGGGVPGFRSHAGYLPEHDVSYAFSSSLIPLPDGTDVGELEKALVPLLLDYLG